MIPGKPWVVNTCPLLRIFFEVLKDDLNSGPTMVKFACVFSFAQLLSAIPWRINVSLQSIDENQGEGIKEQEKHKASFTTWNNQRVWVYFCF